MTSHEHPMPSLVWVAIDIAKYWNAALVELPDGRQQRFRFKHCLEDYDRLVGLLHSFAVPCRIAFEPTADYHRTLGFRLVKEGFEVCLVSSVAGARLREAIFNSWDKNDPKDAEVILRLLKQGMTQRFYDSLIHQIHDLQELSKTYHLISRARTRLQHSLQKHYLPLYFPEIERYWNTTRNDWFVRFMLRFTTPAAIQSLTREAFVEAAWDVVGRKVNKRAQLEELYELAQRSIGLSIARDLRLSRNTVKRALRFEGEAFEYRRAKQPRPKLGPFLQILEEWLEAEKPRRSCPHGSSAPRSASTRRGASRATTADRTPCAGTARSRSGIAPGQETAFGLEAGS